MGLFAYNMLLVLLSPLVVLYFLYQTLISRKFKQSWKQRLTLRLHAIPKEPLIHIHCASMGEAISLIPVVKAIRKSLPDYRLMITALSQTGYTTIVERLHPEIATYLPVDYPFLVDRFYSHYTPKLLLLMETEFWPNLISQAAKHSIPVVVANGRVSPGTLRRYHIFSSLYRPLVGKIQTFLAQSDDDAQRAVEIGIQPGVISVTKDIKYDQIIDNPQNPKLAELKSSLFPPGERVIIAGSTHRGEQEPVVEEFQKLLEKQPDTYMIIAPRHLEAVSSLKSKLKRSKIRYLERSRQLKEHLEWKKEEKVLILDTMGDLAYIYFFGKVAFVGGSLVPVGGHSPLEPAIFGKPVLTGHQAFNFSEANGLLKEAGALTEVDNAKDLMAAMEFLLNTPLEAEKRGQAGLEAVRSVSGASEEIAQVLKTILTPAV